MPWNTEGQRVECGYAIPALYVSPAVTNEELLEPKTSLFIQATLESDRDRFTLSDVNTIISQPPSDIVGQIRTNNQASIGLTYDNLTMLDSHLDVMIPSDAEWSIIKRPTRVVRSSLQFVLFNDYDEFIILQGYQIVADNASKKVRRGN